MVLTRLAQNGPSVPHTLQLPLLRSPRLAWPTVSKHPDAVKTSKYLNMLHKLKLSGYLQTTIVHSCAPRIEPRFLRMCLHIVWTKEPLFLYVFVKFRACIEQLVDVL